MALPLVDSAHYAQAPEAMPLPEQREVEMEMGPAVSIMKPILRFLQLLCENHNHNLQVRPTVSHNKYLGLIARLKIVFLLLFC